MAYEVHLSQFEGPLDLLLHLIEQALAQVSAKALAGKSGNHCTVSRADG